MKLILSEEQQFLKDTAQSFARDKTPVTHFRELRDNENAQCWDETIWKEMVELGWSGILVPEKFGGSDFGMAGISVIMQELGKTLTPSPIYQHPFLAYHQSICSAQISKRMIIFLK